jgi:hypothetical protein
MKIKPEHLPSEINHRLQVLVIDFELFANSANDDIQPRLNVMHKELTKLKNRFDGLTKHEDLDTELLAEGQKKLKELIDKLLEIKMDSKEGKNEKMAVLNQIHYLKDLMFIKNI